MLRCLPRYCVEVNSERKQKCLMLCTTKSNRKSWCYVIKGRLKYNKSMFSITGYRIVHNDRGNQHFFLIYVLYLHCSVNLHCLYLLGNVDLGDMLLSFADLILISKLFPCFLHLFSFISLRLMHVNFHSYFFKILLTFVVF